MAKLEGQTPERVREIILREEHLEELVYLTNQELEASLIQTKERMGGLDSQLEDIDRRLERLYDAVETGKVDLDDLAPRLRELKTKQGLLQGAKAEAVEAMASGRIELVNRDLVLAYLKDFKGVGAWRSTRAENVSPLLCGVYRKARLPGYYPLHPAAPAGAGVFRFPGSSLF